MPIRETILRKQGRELLQKWSKLSGKMRKVEGMPNPTAKKGPKRWPMGAGSVSVLFLFNWMHFVAAG
jgi:hypothetical protein